jgi:hypothetical protein
LLGGNCFHVNRAHHELPDSWIFIGQSRDDQRQMFWMGIFIECDERHRGRTHRRIVVIE